MDIIAEDILKLEYKNTGCNILPMEDMENEKYSINYNFYENELYEELPQSINVELPMARDIESLNNDKYFYSMNSENKVVENFETNFENKKVSFNTILITFIIIILIILFVNWIFSSYDDDIYFNFSDSSPSTSSEINYPKTPYSNTLSTII